MACEKFRKSQDLEPAVGTLLNIAICEEKLGQLVESLRHFREVLGKLPASDDRRPIAKQNADELEARVPRLSVRLDKSVPAGARVLRDSSPLSPEQLSQPLRLDPGTYHFHVEATGHQPARLKVVLVEKQRRELTLTPGPKLEPATTTAASSTPKQPVPTPAKPVAAEPAHSDLDPLAYGAIGVGIAGLVTAASTGLLALGQSQIVDDECNADKQCSQRGLEAGARGRTLSVISLVSLAVGVVGVGAGTYLVVSANGAGATTTPETSAGRWALSFTGTF